MPLIDTRYYESTVCVCILIFEAKAILTPKYNIQILGVLCVRNKPISRSVLCATYLRASSPVNCFDWFLVRSVLLPSAQSFVITIEIIRRGCVGNLTRETAGGSLIFVHCVADRCMAPDRKVSPMVGDARTRPSALLANCLPSFCRPSSSGDTSPLSLISEWRCHHRKARLLLACDNANDSTVESMNDSL